MNIKHIIFSVLLVGLFGVSFASAQDQAPVTLYISQTRSDVSCGDGIAYRWQYEIGQAQLDAMSGDYLVNVNFGGRNGYISTLRVQDGRQFSDTDGGRFWFCESEGFSGSIPSRAAVSIYERNGHSYEMAEDTLIFSRAQAPVIEERIVFEPQNGEAIELVLWEIAVPESLSCDSLFDFALRISEESWTNLDAATSEDHVYAVIYDGINFAGLSHLWLNEQIVSENGGTLCFHGFPPVDGTRLRIQFEGNNTNIPFRTALVEVTVLPG